MTFDDEKWPLLANPEMEPTTALAAAFYPNRNHAWARTSSGACPPVIHLIEDDFVLREEARGWFECVGWQVEDHLSAEAFLADPRPTAEACLVVDINLPRMNGLELLELLRSEGSLVPAIMLTGRSDAAAAIAAVKAGAADFIEKPADGSLILASVTRALERARTVQERNTIRRQAQARLDNLSPREREVMLMVLKGVANKNIAADLRISQRTVESHRACVMQKTGSKSLPALVELFLQAFGPVNLTACEIGSESATADGVPFAIGARHHHTGSSSKGTIKFGTFEV